METSDSSKLHAAQVAALPRAKGLGQIWGVVIFQIPVHLKKQFVRKIEMFGNKMFTESLAH